MTQISKLPVSSPWVWQEDAVCLGMDTELFFHPEGERGGTRQRRVAAAKAICATCPVLKQCREYALANREPYGIWGGMSEEERAAEIRRQTALPA